MRRRDRRPSRQADEIPSGGCVRKRHIWRSRKSGGASLPRRVPSSRSGCVSYHWRFVPRSGCRDESATTRRAGVREANRKPISGAQRPQPATRHLVRQRLLRRLHTRENCSSDSHVSDAGLLQHFMRTCHHPGLSTQPKKGGTSVMRHESNQVDTAMIGARQECLLSASPR